MLDRTAGTLPADGAPASRRAVVSWCFYDFANSPFTTLVVTFIYASYFTQAIAPDTISGTLSWSRAVTVTALAVAVLSPILGVVADRGGYRKSFLLLWTVACVLFTAMLYFPVPGQVFEALLWFTLANISFELALVFYNALLPDIARQDRIGRVSGYGWSLGYVGGLAAMAVAFVGFVDAEVPWFGFSREAGAHIRATNLLVAAWYVVFTLPLLLWVRETQPRAPLSYRMLSSSFRHLAVAFRDVRRYREISKLLLARLLYNDGLVTIFAFGGIYAVGTFGFSFAELVTFGIVINVGAGLGALAFGFVDDRIGGKATVGVSVAALAVATVVGALAPTAAWFWVAAVLSGIFAGPNQSASRSLMARFVPRNRESEFFGFFAFSGKVTSFLGPALLGVLSDLYSQRVGVGSLLIFFLLGGLLLWRVDEREAIAAARAG